MDSILTTIKLLLGIAEDYTHYDVQIVKHINRVFSTLRQLGIGPPGGFRIKDSTSTWSDYLPEGDDESIEFVQTYIYEKVRMAFDPPTSSTHMQALKEDIAEHEWRLNLDAEQELLSEEG